MQTQFSLQQRDLDKQHRRNVLGSQRVLNTACRGTTDVVGQIQSFASEWRAGVWFAVPAFIYTLYNWLLYLNLVYFDPVRASAAAPLTPTARLISCPLPLFRVVG